MLSPAKRPKAANAASRRGNLTVRIRADLKHAIQGHAFDRGRSLSEDVESLLELTLDRARLVDQVFEMTFRDPRLAAVLLLLGDTMRDVADEIERHRPDEHEKPDLTKGWLDDPYVFDQVAEAVKAVLECLRPSGDPVPTSSASVNGKTITGKSVAGGTMLRLIGTWSNHYPWPEIRSRIGNDIIERAKAQLGEAIGPTITTVPHWGDLERISEKNAAGEDASQ